MKIAQRYASDILNLALDTIERNKQALIFVNTRASAEKTAEDISKKIKTVNLEELSQKLGKALPSPTKQCKRLEAMSKRGVVFHHAGLLPKQRELIEDKFREGEIKIICCTPTLAAGLDMPAFRAIIKDLKRFGGTGTWGMSDIPVLEYLQMAGRAGRPGHETYGEAICLASDASMQDEIKEKYIDGEPEEIYSKLAVEPVLRMYILSLVSTKFVKTKAELLKFFAKSFWAHQFGDMVKLEFVINKMINLLKEYEFIEVTGDKSDFVTANDFHNDGLIATPVGQRVAQLYIDPLTANHIITGLKSEDPKELGLLHLVINTLEMRPYLKVGKNEIDIIDEEYAKIEDELINKEPAVYSDDYFEYMQTIKTALFFKEWMNEMNEDYLMEKYKIRPGEIRVKLDRADWLLYAAHELSKMLELHELMTPIAKLRVRVKNGVKGELLPLLKLKGVGRVRARSLFNAGCNSLGELKSFDISKLATLLGKKVAIDLKNQVDVEIDPETIEDLKEKKKGQMKLGSF